MTQPKQYEASYAAYTYSKESGYWVSDERIKEQLPHITFTEDNPPEAGGTPVISNGKDAYVDTSDLHTVIYGLSGVKKSICFFMPTMYSLAMAGENMIINDPKGELFARMSGFLKYRGYRIICLDFRTMNADGYNILGYPARLYKTGRKAEATLMINNLVNALAAKQRIQCKDPFWPDSAAQWLSGTGALMLDSYPEDKVNLINWSDYNKRSSGSCLEEILYNIPETTAKQSIEQTLSASENTMRSILITASSFLAAFNQNDKLAAMLSDSTFQLEDLCEEKTALFIITDDTTSTTDEIVAIIISQIQSYLIDCAFHSEGGKLPTRTSFIIDEFQSLHIPDMENALATHRSRNIRYYLCVQSLAGLHTRYEYPDALLANCGNIFFLGSTEQELLEKISELCGKTNISPNGSERSLVTPAELSSLKKAWSYKQAIYLSPLNGIRYCTDFPSIEAYGIAEYPPAVCYHEHPDADSYTVREFVDDVKRGRIPVPFTKKSSEELHRSKDTSKKRRFNGILAD